VTQGASFVFSSGGLKSLMKKFLFVSILFFLFSGKSFGKELKNPTPGC